MPVLETLTALATLAATAGKAKQAFEKPAGNVSGSASADTQSGGSGLEFTPVGLESLEITPFEYELLNEMYKQQEEPQEMMYGGPLYAENGGGIETLFEDVLFQDVDVPMGMPKAPKSEDFFAEDEKINRQRRKDFMFDKMEEVSSYLDLLADTKNTLDPRRGSSIRARGNIVPGSRSQRGRSLSNGDLSVGGTSVNPFTYKRLKNGGTMVDGVLDRPMFAANYMPNGGEMEGPGGPKDDLIPVMASNGEFMLSKAAVDQAGGGNHSEGIAMLEAFNELGNQRYGR